MAGRYTVDARYGGCLTVRELRPAGDGEYRPSDLHEGPILSLDGMIRDLESLIATIQTPQLRELLERLLGAGGPGARIARPRRPRRTTRPTATDCSSTASLSPRA